MGRVPKKLSEDDEAAAVEISRHWPDRPAWLCAGCGYPYPCPLLREHLLCTMSPPCRAMTMSSYFMFAVIELGGEPGQVHERFFGWTRQ